MPRFEKRPTTIGRTRPPTGPFIFYPAGDDPTSDRIGEGPPGRVYVSSLFQVVVSPLDQEQGEDGWTALSIKRRDRQAVHNWRFMQRIKTELMGADREAVELYPAEDRHLDTANQYWLWVLPAGERFPLGIDDGRHVAYTKDEQRQMLVDMGREDLADFAEAAVNAPLEEELQDG